MLKLYSGDAHVLYCSTANRDGMIKRPGNEGYLNKLIEEERITYSSGLQLAEN